MTPTDEQIEAAYMAFVILADKHGCLERPLGNISGKTGRLLISAALSACPDRDSIVEECASALVAKIDECIPHIDSAFVMAFARMGQEYEGPQLGEELEALRSALKGHQ